MDQRPRMNSATLARSYDVIFVGQLGAVVANLLLKHISFNCKCLIINNTKFVIQPSLSSINCEKIQIRKQFPKNCDLQVKSIAKINPIIKQIFIENGSVYYYKYLVYGENDWVDYEYIPRLKQALSNEFSLVYSNWRKTDLSKIYKYQEGNLIFFIPKTRHSGYQNYNFLWVYSQFLKSKSKDAQENLKCKVILQGTSFLSHNKEGDNFIKNHLRLNNVQLILNSKITKIDYLRRKLTLNEVKQISYTILYCVLKEKTPKLLADAEIDPYDNHPKKLCNKKYSNIFIFGADIFPTTHSFTAINYQAHIIRHNLANMLQKKEQFANYKGQTSLKFWLNEKETVCISHDYRNQGSISSNCLANYFKMLNYRTWAYFEADLFYNLGSDGQPFYVMSPTFLENKNSSSESEEKVSIRFLKSGHALQKHFTLNSKDEGVISQESYMNNA